MSPSNFNPDRINIENLKSNNNKEEMFINFNSKISDGQMSPGSDANANFALRHMFENKSLYSDVGSIELCICGLPVEPGMQNCNSCEGKNSVHMEGEILKKQKKGGVLKKYWFVLLGKELYSYKN